MTNKSNRHRLIPLLHIFSIDVVIGSIMMGLFASRILQVQDPVWWYLVLALSVWVMYTSDHLLDSLKGKKNITIRRHRVHYKYRKRIIPLWVGIAIIAVSIALYKFDYKIVYTGLSLALLVCFYFAVLYYTRQKHPWLLQKELFISLVYVGGIWLAPLVWYAATPPITVLLIITNMILLAWSEGILVSWFEQDDDVSDHHTSFTILFGKKTAKTFVYILLSFVALTSGSTLLFSSLGIILRTALALQIIMSFLLAVILVFPSRFRQNQLYRYLGELTFWLPGLILWA